MMATAAVFGLNAQKLSPNAKALLLDRKGDKATMMSLRDTARVEVESVKAFIEINNPDVLDEIKAMGGKIYCSFGNTATGELPVSVLEAVSELPGVDYVEMGSEVQLCMDEARKATNINSVHENAGNQLPAAYTGAGVVVGVIDTGIEYNHLAFRDQDGKTLRIKRVWNQKVSGGKAPANFNYGIEYSTPEEIKAARYDVASEYHATHTTSIAAGSDLSSKYYGVAPESDIVFVSFGNNTVDIPNAVEYIKDYAKSVGKPCVINMSLGSHKGPHDGSSYLDRYFDSAIEPGCILVGAVGNEGEYEFHVGKKITPDSPLKTLLTIPSTSDKSSAVDIWGRQETPITVKVCLYNAKGKAIETYSASSTDSTPQSKYFSDNGVDAYFKLVPAGTQEGEKPNVYIEFYITSISAGRYIGIEVEGEDGQEVNIWNLKYQGFSSGGFRGFTAGDGEMSAGEIGGTGNSVISVGSYNTRFAFPVHGMEGLYTMGDYDATTLPVGAASTFSSKGPSADGRMKPDVLAPGALVIAAANNYYFEGANTMVNDKTSDADGNTYIYFVNIGTSMASPVVAGSMALWLEAYPELTTDMVREAIAATAKRDANTGSVPNNKSGYGKFDCFNGLKHVLALDGINNIGIDESEAGNGVKTWLEGRELNIASPVAADVELFSSMGTLVKKGRCDNGLTTIDLNGLQSGIYVVRVGGTSAKIAVR